MRGAQVIGIDIDDVLIACNEGLQEWHNKNYGTAHTLDDIVVYPLEGLWGCESPEVQRRINEFFESQDHMELRPVAGAVEAIECLWKAKRCINVITARPRFTRDITEALLREHFPYRAFNDIHFIENPHNNESIMTKGDMCEILECDVAIDDHLAHAGAITAKNIPVLLYDRPWNRQELPKLTTRVHSWDNILQIIL